MKNSEKIIGILGGMGPEATVDFMQRIINNTEAGDDCEHIRCIVDNNPKVPSRIKAIIEGTGESPAPCLSKMAQKLEKWGADFLAMPCNTAHYYYPDVKSAVSIPVLNIIELTVDKISQEHSKAKKIGMLVSPAVRITKLYEKALETKGLSPVYPKPEVEEKLLKVIKAVKSGDTGFKVRLAFKEVVESVGRDGAELAIIGCTELGIIAEEYSIPTIDAANVLAMAAVNKAKENI